VAREIGRISSTGDPLYSSSATDAVEVRVLAELVSETHSLERLETGAERVVHRGTGRRVARCCRAPGPEVRSLSQIPSDRRGGARHDPRHHVPLGRRQGRRDSRRDAAQRAWCHARSPERLRGDNVPLPPSQVHARRSACELEAAPSTS